MYDWENVKNKIKRSEVRSYPGSRTTLELISGDIPNVGNASKKIFNAREWLADCCRCPEGVKNSNANQTWLVTVVGHISFKIEYFLLHI